MASQKQLEGTRVTRKGDSNTKVLAPTFTARGQCPYRPTITPNKTCSANLYRGIKRRVGRSLKCTHCKRHLVPSGKQVAYQLPRPQGSLSSLKRVPRPRHTQDSTCRDTQHHSGVIHKQGRRPEVGPILCSNMENLDLVHQKSSNSQSPTHSRPAECGSRQAIQARPDHPNRVFSSSGGLPSNMQQVAPASNRLICYKVQQQVALVCVAGTRFPGHSSGCTKSAMRGSGCICLPTSSHLGQSGGDVVRLPIQKNHSDCSGVAQPALVFWDLVTMSSQIPLSLPSLFNLLIQPFSQIPHRNLTNLNLHAWVLEPHQSISRASLKQWQQELRLLKEDQPDQSMRQVDHFYKLVPH